MYIGNCYNDIIVKPVISIISMSGNSIETFIFKSLKLHTYVNMYVCMYVRSGTIISLHLKYVYKSGPRERET